MLSQSVTNDLCRAYRVALFLTASVTGAEYAVTWAIDRDPDALHANAVLAALLWPGLQDTASADTIPELLPVTQLSRVQRHCFVLRTLEGMPATICGQLLEMSPAEVNAQAVLAAAVQSAGRHKPD